MGLPTIEIEFKTRAETAVTRSQNGIVALILCDDTETGATKTSYSYNLEDDIIKSHWTTQNLDYLNKAFLGAPKRVLVERVAASELSEGNGYDDALARLKNKDWNWLAIPGIANDKVQSIVTWISAQRAARKGFKAVLPCSAASVEANHEGVVNFATEEIAVGTKTYSAAEYCARIAGLLAGLPLDQSATYQVLAEVASIKESTDPDGDIDDGKMILINDGEKVKIGRGINSLKTLSGDKTADFKKIKIIEAMDLMRADIRETFENNYIGVVNSYDNKMMFVAAVNQYFDQLVREGVLYDEGQNVADIDVDAQRAYLATLYDVSDYSDDQIRKAKTGSFLFVAANVSFADALEDLRFNIYME